MRGILSNSALVKLKLGFATSLATAASTAQSAHTPDKNKTKYAAQPNWEKHRKQRIKAVD
jgi:hypothetical protein